MGLCQTSRRGGDRMVVHLGRRNCAVPAILRFEFLAQQLVLLMKMLGY